MKLNNKLKMTINENMSFKRGNRGLLTTVSQKS